MGFVIGVRGKGRALGVRGCGEGQCMSAWVKRAIAGGASACLQCVVSE